MSDTLSKKSEQPSDSSSSLSQDAAAEAAGRCLQEVQSPDVVATVQPVGKEDDPKKRAAADSRVEPVSRADSAEQADWRKEVVRTVTADVQAKNWTAAALHFTEYASGNTPEESAKVLSMLSGAFKNPANYSQFDADGELRQARWDNGIVNDSPLFLRPAVEGTPLKDSDLERLAEHFEAVKELDYKGQVDEGIVVRRSDVKNAAEYLMNEALKLDKTNMHAVLKRASDISYRRGHSLNVVFADLDGDGKAEELSDVAVNYQRQGSYATSIERIDLYDPPAPRK
ncbi:MAG: hypothetical protein K2W95_13575 [Candidatus Obscuribacterales bacterium]|nr:hypothetical protein [Candidatus Obscuribacterales bacterium]